MWSHTVGRINVAALVTPSESPRSLLSPLQRKRAARPRTHSTCPVGFPKLRGSLAAVSLRPGIGRSSATLLPRSLPPAKKAAVR